MEKQNKTKKSQKDRKFLSMMKIVSWIVIINQQYKCNVHNEKDFPIIFKKKIEFFIANKVSNLPQYWITHRYSL